MTTKVYTVVKCGVYRHECCGVFVKKDIAIAVAEKVCKNESDDYRDFEVYEFEIGIPVEDGKLVATISRTDCKEKWPKLLKDEQGRRYWGFVTEEPGIHTRLEEGKSDDRQ